MFDNQKYDLESGPFTMCTGYWDKNNDTFRKFQSTDTYKCCLTTCFPDVEECNKLCTNIKKGSVSTCNKICENVKKACYNYCQLSTPNYWGMNDPIYEGIKTLGCGEPYYNIIDKKCLEINKDKIINMCKYKCIPTISIGCENHCKYMYNYLINYDTEYKSILDDSLLTKTLVNNDKYIKYILYAIFISFILVALYIFKTKMIY
jgi:hypothetical protein